jgi:hypothetical protein
MVLVTARRPDRAIQPQTRGPRGVRAGTVATINYVDIDAQPQRVDDAVLPWSYDKTTTDPAVFVNVVAQGNSDTIGCRITIDNVVKDERSVATLNAYTYCLDKSG